MNSDSENPVSSATSSPVVCADHIGALYRQGIRAKTILILVVVAVTTLLDYWLRSPWIGVLTVLSLGGGIVVPHIFRIHRAFASISCPGCGVPVGRYETRKSRIILLCQHCGSEAPTDCGFSYSGSPPHKL